jgi:prolyl-tRNA synthetase
MGRDEAVRKETYEKSDHVADALRSQNWHGLPIRVKVDKRDKESPGFKYNDWEMKGACVRVEIGPRDLENGQCVVCRRDTGEKVTIGLGDNTASEIIALLTLIQQSLFDRALAFRETHTHRVDTWEEFEKLFSGEGAPGFVLAHWDGTADTENKISEKTKATIRCIPLEPLHPDDNKPGVCVLTGKPSKQRVVFAKAY